jgi:hypothetical protein
MIRISQLASVRDETGSSPDWVAPSQRRRMDPLARSACLAVDAILKQGAIIPADTALIASTSYGAVDSTLRFVTSIATFSDRSASPTPFTTSVHSSCAGSLGELLGIHGPCTTISQGALGTLSALRWAALMLAARRAPAVLAVIGDRHNDWSRRMVSELANSRWPVGDGITAALLEPGDGGGREFRLGNQPAARSIDGGALTAEDEQALASAADGQQRVQAPQAIGAWWPCCLLSAFDDTRWRDEHAWNIREAEDGIVLAGWLGPWKEHAAVSVTA